MKKGTLSTTFQEKWLKLSIKLQWLDLQMNWQTEENTDYFSVYIKSNFPEAIDIFQVPDPKKTTWLWHWTDTWLQESSLFQDVGRITVIRTDSGNFTDNQQLASFCQIESVCDQISALSKFTLFLNTFFQTKNHTKPPLASTRQKLSPSSPTLPGAVLGLHFQINFM